MRGGLSSTRRAEEWLKSVSLVPGKITARERLAARLKNRPLCEIIPFMMKNRCFSEEVVDVLPK
jgi:hypothetical protein